MCFIIIDTTDPEMYTIICDEDGKTMFFDTAEDGCKYAHENLQLTHQVCEIE